MIKNNIDICLTPSTIDLFDISDKKVIIIDVFRATSAMCVFLNNGGEYVVPVATVEEAIKYKELTNNNKYLFAAERNGEVVSGFDLGNSPFSYDSKNFQGVHLTITTTNGTLAINKSKEAGGGMLLASFLNVTAVVDYILSSPNDDILIICSGWKGRFCLEDLLLAGCLSNKLLSTNHFFSTSDSVLMAGHIYDLAKVDLLGFLSNSSYYNRMNLEDDMKYCLQQDIMNTVPVWLDKIPDTIFSSHTTGGFYSNKHDVFNSSNL